jgi:hypothetical protein
MTDHLTGVIAILMAGLFGTVPWLALITARMIEREGLWQFAMNLLAGWTT